MEEFENEYDKGIYWVIFFIILLVIAIVGYKFTFGYNKENSKNNSEEIEEDDVNFSNYKGVWAFLGEDDEPTEELLINIIDGSTITFDYFIKDIAYFESQTASLEGNQANFDMMDRDMEINVSGRIIFRNEKIFLIITSSSDENISPGTIEFVDKKDNSFLSSYKEKKKKEQENEYEDENEKEEEEDVLDDD